MVTWEHYNYILSPFIFKHRWISFEEAHHRSFLECSTFVVEFSFISVLFFFLVTGGPQTLLDPPLKEILDTPTKYSFNSGSISKLLNFFYAVNKDISIMVSSCSDYFSWCDQFTTPIIFRFSSRCHYSQHDLLITQFSLVSFQYLGSGQQRDLRLQSHQSCSSVRNTWIRVASSLIFFTIHANTSSTMASGGTSQILNAVGLRPRYEARSWILQLSLLCLVLIHKSNFYFTVFGVSLYEFYILSNVLQTFLNFFLLPHFRLFSEFFQSVFLIKTFAFEA